ncbi:hypothetical protein NYR90_03065 [Clostridioides difficile]|nr:hypothetical protein NYR90_03065 [Clostridioides difficile]
MREVDYFQEISFIIGVTDKEVYIIDSVERYRITMVTGTMIPIPEKRYFKVREEIDTIMQKIGCFKEEHLE